MKIEFNVKNIFILTEILVFWNVSFETNSEVLILNQFSSNASISLHVLQNFQTSL